MEVRGEVREEEGEQEAVREGERLSDEGWRLDARGPALRNTPQLCREQELDQKQTEGKGASTGEGTPLKGHNVTWRAAWQTWDKIYMDWADGVYHMPVTYFIFISGAVFSFKV